MTVRAARAWWIPIYIVRSVAPARNRWLWLAIHGSAIGSESKSRFGTQQELNPRPPGYKPGVWGATGISKPTSGPAGPRRSRNSHGLGRRVSTLKPVSPIAPGPALGCCVFLFWHASLAQLAQYPFNERVVVGPNRTGGFANTSIDLPMITATWHAGDTLGFPSSSYNAIVFAMLRLGGYVSDARQHQWSSSRIHGCHRCELAHSVGACLNSIVIKFRDRELNPGLPRDRRKY